MSNFNANGVPLDNRFVTWEEIGVLYQTLWTWGYNNHGQLGTNDITNQSSPVQTIAGGTNWKSVASGGNHTVAIKTDGTLWSWGYNQFGQLGNNNTTHQSSPVQTIAGGTDWQSVDSGNNHTVAIKTDGTLWSWGVNDYGQLGINNITYQSSPVQTISSGTNWKLVASGFYHTVAIKTDGTLWLWGRNDYGQLGTNNITHQSSPVQTIAGGTDWKLVAGGANHTVAIKTDGTLWIWGQNTSGQLGNNSRTNQSSPVQTIAGGTDWKSVACGFGHTVAIKTDGTLWTWGYNNNGQLGTNNITNQSIPVQTIASGTDWKLVAGGFYHTFAIKTDGTLWTWGQNAYGQLGTNNRTNQSSPVQTVSSGTDWELVAGGRYHTVAIKTDGTLWTWGRNDYGQLGINNRSDRSSPVQTISGGTNWKSVSSGNNHTVAIKTDGTLWTWGYNFYGELGNNSRTNQSSPVQTIAGGTDWKSVAGGFNHTVAIKTDGTLWTWGRNSQGQLGINNIADQSSPVQTIAGGTNWKSVASGHSHTVAIKTDGTLWAWGWNNIGQLGTNDIANRLSPVQTVASGTNWKSVAGGGYHTVALKA